MNTTDTFNYQTTSSEQFTITLETLQICRVANYLKNKKNAR